jgi:hypothetical protein
MKGYKSAPMPPCSSTMTNIHSFVRCGNWGDALHGAPSIGGEERVPQEATGPSGFLIFNVLSR